MRAGRTMVLLFSGIFILLSCVILTRSLVEKGILQNGDGGMAKAVITVKNQMTSDKARLKPGDVKKLADILGTKEFCYTARPALFKASVKAGRKSIVSGITGTNHLLPRFSRMNMIYGSFFAEAAQKEGGYVAVIDDRLAWNAFMTVNAIGKKLEIYGKIFKIVGVVKRDTSILGKLADDGFPEVFIPGDKLLELDMTAGISSLQVGTEDTSTMDNNRKLISGALQEIGKNPSDYSIVDFNIKQALLKQKPDIIIFLLGSIVILIALSWLVRTLKEIITVLYRECRADYLMNVIRKNWRETGIAAIKAVSAIITILLVGAGIRFSLFIPPALIPEELIDISFYFELIRGGIRSSIENQGYVAGAAELLLVRLDMLTGWTLSIMIAVGLILAYASFARLKLLNVEMHKLSLACGVFILISLGILAIIANISGLPFSIKTGNILVVWAFIYINILFFYYVNKKGKCKNG